VLEDRATAAVEACCRNWRLDGIVFILLVTSPQGGLTPLGIVPRFQKFQVVGIFASGFYQYDSSYAFMRLADAQRLFSEPDVISIISFKVDDLYKANVIGREIEQAAGPGFQATNWMEQNRELFRALKLEQIVTFIVLALIVWFALEQRRFQGPPIGDLGALVRRLGGAR